jgi:hypothetical protein
LSFVSLLSALACATRFESGPLFPIPRATPGPGLPYAQVRQYGQAAPFHVIWLRFDGERQRHVAVTIDVHNDTAGPLLLELSRAQLRHQGNGQVATRNVVAAGFGDIPRAIDLDAPGEPALELEAQASRTIWLAFAPLPPGGPPGRVGRVHVVVPVTAAGELSVQIHDDEASPDWTPVVTSAFGLNLGVGGSFFDNSRGRFNHVDGAVFVARGPVTGAATLGAFTLHERLRGGIAHASGPSLGVDLSFRPPDFAVGAFVAGNYLAVDFDQASGEPDRSLFGATIGLVCPLEGGIAPRAALRFGYTHLFGDKTPYHGGLFAALQARLFVD